MIVLIDNYDSFSYNLYQAMGELGEDIRVIKNDDVTVDKIRELRPTHLVISPGPGFPKDAGNCLEVVRECAGQLPILGVCLGHQVICEAFGAKIIHATDVMHGKQSEIILDLRCALFHQMSEHIVVGRYHSLVAQRESIPNCLQVIATTKKGEVMGVKHNRYPVFGLQFHPESILTPNGTKMISNFIALRGNGNDY